MYTVSLLLLYKGMVSEVHSTHLQIVLVYWSWIYKMDFSNLFVFLLLLLSLLSLSYSLCVQKSCPLGMFCPIEANCNNNTNLCVAECDLRTTQGNWSSGNCENGK